MCGHDVRARANIDVYWCIHYSDADADADASAIDERTLLLAAIASAFNAIDWQHKTNRDTNTNPNKMAWALLYRDFHQYDLAQWV